MPKHFTIAAGQSVAIQVRGLTIARGTRVILKDLYLQIEAGEIVALLGVNGAGKTTLLRCLTGLLRPAAGEILLFGESLQRNLAARRLIGVVTHEPLVYAALTPHENLRLAADLCDVDHPEERIDELLVEAGLKQHAQRPTSELSCGLRQRLSIARALVHRPSILLLDEPFSGLDEHGRDWLRDLLKQLRCEGTTVCLSTHDWQLAREISDRLILLHNGATSDMADQTERTVTTIWAATA